MDEAFRCLRVDGAKPIAIGWMAGEASFSRRHRMPLLITFRFGEIDKFALMSRFDSVVTEAAIWWHHWYSPRQEVRAWFGTYTLAWCSV